MFTITMMYEVDHALCNSYPEQFVVTKISEEYIYQISGSKYYECT